MQANTFDPVGNIVAMTTKDGQTLYQYDRTYRLTAVDHPDQADELYSYDAVSNRLTSAEHANWFYNARNQLVGYAGVSLSYDANGNLIQKIDATGTTSFTYDLEDRLIGVQSPDGSVVTYKYDVFGRRIEKNVNGTATLFIYDNAWLLAEFHSNGALQKAYLRASADASPSLAYDDQSRVFFFPQNHLSTPQFITDGAGATVWEARFKSFGEADIQNSQIANAIRFPGQYFDGETSLHYNYFRDYDPVTGRYIEQDPVGIEGGINLYAYVDGNPVNRGDPKGLGSGSGGPYHPPAGVRTKCTPADSCPQIKGKMAVLMRMINSHQGWDWHNPPPRGGGRHSQEIAELWKAYAKCQSLYISKKCDQEQQEQDCKDCAKRVVPVVIGTGVAAYIVWKVVKTCACGLVGGPVGAGVCLVTP